MKVLTQPSLWHQEQLLQFVTCFLERKNPDLSCEILMLTNSSMPFFVVAVVIKVKDNL